MCQWPIMAQPKSMSKQLQPEEVARATKYKPTVPPIIKCLKHKDTTIGITHCLIRSKVLRGTILRLHLEPLLVNNNSLCRLKHHLNLRHSNKMEQPVRMCLKATVFRLSDHRMFCPLQETPFRIQPMARLPQELQ